MKKILFVTVFVLIALFSASIYAAEITVKWDPQADAMGFNLSKSIDNGVTWDTPLDVGNVTVAPYNVPDSGLTLIRVGAYNNVGLTWRLDAGVWYNGDWVLPSTPTGTGIQ